MDMKVLHIFKKNSKESVNKTIATNQAELK